MVTLNPRVQWSCGVIDPDFSVSQGKPAFFWEHRNYNTERGASKVFLSEQLQETPESCLISVLIRQPELQEEAEFKNESTPSLT